MVTSHAHHPREPFHPGPHMLDYILHSSAAIYRSCNRAHIAHYDRAPCHGCQCASHFGQPNTSSSLAASHMTCRIQRILSVRRRKRVKFGYLLYKLRRIGGSALDGGSGTAWSCKRKHEGGVVTEYRRWRQQDRQLICLWGCFWG